jgi:hypothetical protein
MRTNMLIRMNIAMTTLTGMETGIIHMTMVISTHIRTLMCTTIPSRTRRIRTRNTPIQSGLPSMFMSIRIMSMRTIIMVTDSGDFARILELVV